MQINTISSLDNFSGTVLIPVFETETAINFEEITISLQLFSGKKDSHYIIQKDSSIYIFVGLGKSINYKDLKTTFRRISSKQKQYFTSNVAFFIPEEFNEIDVESAVSGLFLGTYNLGHFKKNEAHPFLKLDFELQLISKNDYLKPASKGIKIAQAQLEVFNLVDLPPNVVTPKYLANWATASGDKYGFSTEIFGFDKCKELGLDAFISVGKGSENEPQFVIMNYVPEKTNSETKHIGLVGKGIIGPSSGGFVHRGRKA